MNPERIAAIKSAVKKNGVQRRKRVITVLKARVEQVERQKPATLAEAVSLARQSRRWRKRLGRFVKLDVTMFPTHALIVDLWGQQIFFRSGTLKRLERVVDDLESVRNAGYKIVCLSDLMKEGGMNQVENMDLMQGKEGQNND